MAKRQPYERRSGGKGLASTLKQGTNNSPSNPDSSMKCGSGSVDSNPTRSGTAPTPKSLGGRTA